MILIDKLKSLGWKPRKLEETLTDSIEYFDKAGVLHDEDGKPCRLPPLFLPYDRATGAQKEFQWCTQQRREKQGSRRHGVAAARVRDRSRRVCRFVAREAAPLPRLRCARHRPRPWSHPTVDVDYKLAMSSEKLRNLGWKPKSLEDTLADGLEYLENSGLLKEPCRLPYFYRVNAEE
ncbi:hypothetical protein EJB05_43567, partial [Eragrostis curvula]